MKLIISRHGETDSNLRRELQGHGKGMLTENGIDQAKRLALRLKDYKFDIMYCSDLDRAVDTVKEIKKHHPDTEVIYTEKLRERNMGEYEGKTVAELGFDKPEFKDKPWPEAKGGETVVQLMSRAKEIIDEIYNNHKGKTILILSHGIFATSIIANIIGKSFDETISSMKIENTAVYEIEFFEDKSHKIHIMNCTKHLD